ncbi:MAG: Crp/Fnr family transcriptional regulator [Burkholderiales bacterium]|nr:Crp/Fnr family transcriptional regulator [Burkholderiales bacterium]
MLVQKGDHGDLLHLISAGRVRIFPADADGHEVTYAVIWSCEYFGEMSLGGAPSSALVITIEATACAVLKVAAVKLVLAESPEFGLHLLTTVIRRAREATEAARGLALDGVYRRLKGALERSATTPSDGDRLAGERLTQPDIAARIGRGRKMVSRWLKDLEAGRYLMRNARGISLLISLPERG